MVAYLEALDHFAGRFAEFIRVRVQGASTGRTRLQQLEVTAQIRRDFITSEPSGTPVTGTSAATLGPMIFDIRRPGPGGGIPATIRLPPIPGVGTIVPNPDLNGSDDEGSVYGCIFVDFARRVGLRTVVNAYLRSASAGALTFGEYKAFIGDTRPRDLASLEAAQVTWGL